MTQGPAYWELIAAKLKGLGWQMTITTKTVHGIELHLIDARQDEFRAVVLTDDLLAGFLEVEASVAASGT